MIRLSRVEMDGSVVRFRVSARMIGVIVEQEVGCLVGIDFADRDYEEWRVKESADEVEAAVDAEMGRRVYMAPEEGSECKEA